MRILVIYDDTGRKSEVIKDIIGDKGFADVVIKKKRLEEYYQDEIKKLYPDAEWRKIQSILEYTRLIKELDCTNDNGANIGGGVFKILHCFSNYLILDSHSALLSFKKLSYIDSVYGVLDGKRSVAAMFPDIKSYIRFCKKIISGQRAWDLVRDIEDTFEISGLIDIGVVGNFIQCVTGNFDSRYFNSLKGNEYTLVKSSTNKKKIKAEYCFYHLLPEDMKYWFVMPFNYKEEANSASYTMERLYMTDLSIKWVHGSMDTEEFEELMDKYFFFFKSRHVKACSKEEYNKVSNRLYLDKVNERIDELKKRPEYCRIKKFLETSKDTDIDSLVLKYSGLKKKIEAKNNYPQVLVIGHGDPCFANALYNKSTKTLKFIDPKGAVTEDELWTNPYYDIAKLSHSVCGRYDFFNNALFDIKVNNLSSLDLEIPFDNKKYIEIFKRKAEENAFDYPSIRIYEASLFLSMLPLHIDNPHKVLGFILNAKNILEDIEKNV